MVHAPGRPIPDPVLARGSALRTAGWSVVAEVAAARTWLEGQLGGLVVASPIQGLALEREFAVRTAARLASGLPRLAVRRVANRSGADTNDVAVEDAA